MSSDSPAHVGLGALAHTHAGGGVTCCSHCGIILAGPLKTKLVITLDAAATVLGTHPREMEAGDFTEPAHSSL